MSPDVRTPEFASLADLLDHRGREQPDLEIYRFVDGDEVVARLTCRDMLDRVRGIARKLLAAGLAGQRALLLYSPGLEFLLGFCGCVYAGVVAVPVYPPDPLRLDKTLPRLRSIVRDARPSAILSDAAPLGMVRMLGWPAARSTWPATCRSWARGVAGSDIVGRP